MIRFLLDTDIVSLLQDGNKLVISRVVSLPPNEIATSIITVEEQLSAWYTLLRNVRSAEQLVPVYSRMTSTVQFLSKLPLLTFDAQAAGIFVQLRKLHPRLGRMDLRIAAIGLASGATLVTRNLSDFEEIEDLILEDWSKLRYAAARRRWRGASWYSWLLPLLPANLAIPVWRRQ